MAFRLSVVLALKTPTANDTEKAMTNEHDAVLGTFSFSDKPESRMTKFHKEMIAEVCNRACGVNLRRVTDDKVHCEERPFDDQELLSGPLVYLYCYRPVLIAQLLADLAVEVSRDALTEEEIMFKLYEKLISAL